MYLQADSTWLSIIIMCTIPLPIRKLYVPNQRSMWKEAPSGQCMVNYNNYCMSVCMEVTWQFVYKKIILQISIDKLMCQLVCTSSYLALIMPFCDR